VDVDEPGRHNVAAGVEDRARVRRQALADGGDAAAVDGDVRPAAGRPGAVDHGPAPDHQFGHLVPLLLGSNVI
jgi:hypothetical protein